MNLLNGLILTGGHSRRMGRDKALIKFEGVTLLDRSANLISLFTKQLHVSVRPDQIDEPNRAKYPLIVDQENDNGPIAGILSAGDFERENAWLVIACDMPYLDKESIEQLVLHRNLNKMATVFESPDGSGVEPLCAIYEPVFFEEVRSNPQLIHNSSPRETLAAMDLEIIKALNPRALYSANSSSDELG